ncbi:MAG TPA: GAF domain-containing sensor histidine kinase, partial [Anaerolineales bacterium]|nr:GAF domain-containing sensor histidine kinase [Anaerolineales bacterium]
FIWLFTNRKWNERWGEMTGKSLLKESPWVVETGMFDRFVSAMQSAVPLVQEQYYADERFNGWFIQSLVLVEDGLLVTTFDITQLKQAEEALHRSKSQLAKELEDTQQLQKISSQLIHEDNIEVLYRQILQAAISLMHSDMGSLQMSDPETEQLRLLAWKGFHPESAAYWDTITDESSTLCGRALRTGERQIVPDLNSPDFVTDSENRKQYQLSGILAMQSTPLISRYGRPVGMISTHWSQPHVPGEHELRMFDVLARQAADVLERARAEEALRESEQRLKALNETLEQKVHEKTIEVRRLASDVVTAIQRERQRISHVLHDDLQQRVFAVQMQMSFLKDALAAENESARQEASDIERELAEIVKITRDLSLNLSPPILPGEGLAHALEWFASRVREQFDLAVEIQTTEPYIIANEELHVLLFNFVRELLFNVVKHAGASQAVIRMESSDQHLRIEVHDNGKGFPIDAPDGRRSPGNDLPRSLGLPTIRHQLSLLGGKIEINSKPEAGTQVILTVPVIEGQ